ncbi:MAG TPA: HD domain-containing phosphohydrolase [Sulfuricurvum sp.]|nr:HD domain-containing phosphohydrolase [Sulfuricurvum sp.]
MGKMTVMIVDDEPRNIQVASNVLKEVENIHILYATSGEQALERLNEHPIDLVLLDMMMPDMNGLDVCHTMKENPKLQTIPIIFLTAKTDEDTIIQAFDAGASDYITKPFLSRELQSRVKTQLKLAMTQKELQDDLTENKELLRQYKDIVDASSIVSKTDLLGKITYVNDKFCEMSGYTREELLGHQHNMVRHPDVEKEVFKDLWKTIKQNKSWNGIVKNRKKNGEVYVVSSYVAPIVDAQGVTQEYISIRQDITPIVLLTQEVRETQQELLLILGFAVESRSKETAMHVRRVAEYAKLLARHKGLNAQQQEEIWSVAPLHDVGKVGIPDAILNKAGKLTEEEYEIMKDHAKIGWDILNTSKHALIQAAAIVAHEHHEKWDGTGYPRALAGENIHIYGRITSIADVFDALGTERVYKKAWDRDQILDYFIDQKGSHFDPSLVEIILENADDFFDIRRRFNDA